MMKQYLLFAGKNNLLSLNLDGGAILTGEILNYSMDAHSGIEMNEIADTFAKKRLD